MVRICVINKNRCVVQSIIVAYNQLSSINKIIKCAILDVAILAKLNILYRLSKR